MKYLFLKFWVLPLVVIFALSPLSLASGSKRLKLTDIAVSTPSGGAAIMAGNSFGIGGDTRDPRYVSAWFYGNQPITTCYTYIESFGVQEKEIKAHILAAIKTWQQYFKDKKVNSDAAQAINTRFVLNGRCRGEEDLRLHFGSGPIWQNLLDLKAVQTLEKPVAYLNKTHIAEDMLWSRGYIRFVSQGYYSELDPVFPNWKQSGALRKMIIHELGHVLGFRHVEDTIMSPSIAKSLFLSADRPTPATVDHKQGLVSCSGCAASYKIDQADAALLKRLSLTKRTELKYKGAKEISFVAGKATHRLKDLRITETSKDDVLISNFAHGAHQRSSTAYGSLAFGDQVIPVVIEFATGTTASVQVFVDGKFQYLGVFNAN